MAVVTLTLAPFHEQINSTTIALALLLVVLVVATIYCFRCAFRDGDHCQTAFILCAAYARRRAEESEAKRKEIERLYQELQTAFERASQTEVTTTAVNN